MPFVTVFKCGSCGEHFDEPGEAVYNCSRCGQDQVEDRRCQQCNIFMAKVADQSCPDCEDGEDIAEVEAWQSEDGQFFESEAEERQYIADAPKREAQRIKSEASTKALMERMRQEKIARCKALEPRLTVFIPLSKAAPKLHRTATETLADIHRDPERAAVYTPYIYLSELAALLIPDYPNLEALIERATDYGNVDVNERLEIEKGIRDAVIAELPQNEATTELMERINRGHDFSLGTGLGCEMEQMLDLLLDPLLKRAIGE